MGQSKISPKLVILNHGEPQGSQHFKEFIEAQLEFKTTIAEYGEEFNLDQF